MSQIAIAAPSAFRSRPFQFIYRHFVPLGFLVAGLAWAIATHVLAREVLDDRAEGIAEVSFVSLATLTAIAVEIAADRAKSRHQAAVETVEVRARAAQSDLERVVRERVAVASRLALLEPLATIEATATAICRELARLPGVDFAALDSFDGPSAVRIVATSGVDMPIGIAIPDARARELRERASAGAWVERRADPGHGRFGDAVSAANVKALAVSPINVGGAPVGIVMVGATDEAHADLLVEQLPALTEFAVNAQALLGQALLARRDESTLRQRIEGILGARAFHPVFQPVMNLVTNRPIGYEALTRFDDGTPPDRFFAEATRTGLGTRAETATLSAAVIQGDALPRGTWLALNASPAFIVAGGLGPIMAARTRPTIIEVTEHEPIADYGAVRDAIAALGSHVQVSVDDAGAGVANFSHMVDLRPDFVKLDISIIRGIDGDLVRQALVVGLSHFARAMGHYVIAEGVETNEELATLRLLDITLGQGYLLGRPVDIVST